MPAPLLHRGRPSPWVLPLLALLVLVCVAVAIMAGRYGIGPGRMVEAIAARATGGVSSDRRADSVVFNLRLPRITVAVLIGSGMAVSGAAFQSLFSNPLATPDTLGVASGTCVGAVVALLLGRGMIGV